MEKATQKIHAAIIGVMADVGAVGKKNKNKDQGFMYRGIDAVMNALQPAMIKNKLFVVPTVVSEERTERQTAKGGTLFYTRLRVKYEFIAEDGSSVVAEVIGEAMDSGDKATNKAMSIAYKYACFQVFCIPTEEMHDPDKETHDDLEPQVIYVDEVKIKVLKSKMEKKGVTEKQVFELCKVAAFEEMTVAQFTSVMNKLEKTPDKEIKQVNIF